MWGGGGGYLLFHHSEYGSCKGTVLIVSGSSTSE